MSETPNLEDLLAAIATLTEHNTALLERIEEKDQATKDRDAANAKLVNDLIAQLKDFKNERMSSNQRLLLVRLKRLAKRCLLY